MILQAGKVYSNLHLNNTKYDIIKLSIVEKEYVNACMSANILSDWKKDVVPKEFLDLWCSQ